MITMAANTVWKANPWTRVFEAASRRSAQISKYQTDGGEIMNAIIDAFAAHTTMSMRALIQSACERG
jgi:hypothetical protein